MVSSLLTLDIATRSGFCNWKPGHDPVIGNKDVSGCELGEALYRFEKWLRNNIETNDVDFLAFEAPILIRRGPKTTGIGVARRLYSLTGIVEKLCFELDVRVSETEISEWRLHFLGDGGLRSDKAKEMAMQKCRGLGLDPKYHDEAEAFGIMDYAADLLHLDHPWPAGPLFKGGFNG